MRASRKASFIIVSVLMTGGIILCAVCWKAWFGNPEEPEWTQDTIHYSFHTFGEESLDGFARYQTGHSVNWQDLNQPDTLTFLLLGDVHNSIDSLQWEALAVRHPHLDFYAQLGDFLERPYFYYHQQLVSELEGTPFERLPVVNVPGNHEYRKGIVRHLPLLWYDVFPQPLNGPHRFLCSTYYVDFPALRLIAIDTNGLQRLSDYTIVNTWVRQTIRRAGNRFVVVMMHHPVFSAGDGRQNPLIWLTFRRVLQNADIVFAGHDHNYARRLPFIVTNSAKKFYLNKINPKDTRICSGRQLYNVVTIKRHTSDIGRTSSASSDTLCVETRLMDTGELYDLVKVVHTPDIALHGSDSFLTEYIEPMNGCPEIIDLPEKYKGKDSRKVRRFLRRRTGRLAR
ncbi:MAG: metallophosphoesterase [Paludibacteraceae bacterium]|nr:metallophosphoesterase [Paludibacteraceae bacterium]